MRDRVHSLDGVGVHSVAAPGKSNIFNVDVISIIYVDRPLDDARFTALAPLSRRYRVLRSTSLPYVRCDRLRPSRKAGALPLLLNVIIIRVVLSRIQVQFMYSMLVLHRY